MAVLSGVLECSFGFAPRDFAPRHKLGTSGTGRIGFPCDVLFRYGSEPTPCGCQVARLPRLARPPLASPQAIAGRARMAGWHAHPLGARFAPLRPHPIGVGPRLCGLATAVHE